MTAASNPAGGRLRFRVLEQRFAICRLPAQSAPPAWATAGTHFWLARTAEELSVVCAEHLVPPETTQARGFACLRLAGPFALNETGVLASFLAPLAEAKAAVFAVSTYDTDYIFVAEEQLSAARRALQEAGHEEIAG